MVTTIGKEREKMHREVDITVHTREENNCETGGK